MLRPTESAGGGPVAPFVVTTTTIHQVVFTFDKASSSADPTYHDLVDYAGNAGSEIIRVPVNESLHIDLDAIASAIRLDTKLVYLVNPNNPIPTIIEKNALRDFILEISKDRMANWRRIKRHMIIRPKASQVYRIGENTAMPDSFR